MKKHRPFTLRALTALILTLCLTAQAQQPGQALTGLPADEARVVRLVGLAKVWGAVKYFHPFLAYRDIDWDKALVETIPKVEAAKTPQEYAAAINQMLDALGDKSTRGDQNGRQSRAADESTGDFRERTCAD